MRGVGNVPVPGRYDQNTSPSDCDASLFEERELRTEILHRSAKTNRNLYVCPVLPPTPIGMPADGRVLASGRTPSEGRA